MVHRETLMFIFPLFPAFFDYKYDKVGHTILKNDNIGLYFKLEF